MASLEEADVCDVVHVAVEVCGIEAESQGHHASTWPAPATVFAPINPPLLEQAVVNLVDNAIKYSPEGGTVVVAAGSETPDEVAIVVERPRPRHRPGAPAAALRAVLPRRQGPQPRARRHRPGPGHRQAHRPGARRPRLGHQRGRHGQHLQDPSAARLSRLRRPLRAAPRPPRLTSSSSQTPHRGLTNPSHTPPSMS